MKTSTFTRFHVLPNKFSSVPFSRISKGNVCSFLMPPPGNRNTWSCNKLVDFVHGLIYKEQIFNLPCFLEALQGAINIFLQRKILVQHVYCCHELPIERNPSERRPCVELRLLGHGVLPVGALHAVVCTGVSFISCRYVRTRIHHRLVLRLFPVTFGRSLRKR